MKLNVGCGSKLKGGYVNIDIHSPSADIKAYADDLPFEEESIHTIESYHLIEHMSFKDAIKTLEHWYILLQYGGHLVIECPDLYKVMVEYVKGNADMIYSIYGRDRYPYDTHLWGYTPMSITTLLTEIGFRNIVVTEGTDYHADFEPCMRVEAIR